MKRTKRMINRRAVFAEIHQDTRGDGRPHEFAIAYTKVDGTLGEKARVTKSTSQRLPGSRGYRGNVNLNNVLLLTNQENGKTFEVIIDLLTHYNGMRINHSY